MTDDEREARLSGYLDDELTAEERVVLERDVDADPGLALELERLRAMKEVTHSMKLKEFPDHVWDAYVTGTYNRVERRIGWVLFSLGAIVLLAAGLYELALALLRESADPWWVRIAVGACVAGLAVLFVSVLRERLFVLKRDPYKEVQR